MYFFNFLFDDVPFKTIAIEISLKRDIASSVRKKAIYFVFHFFFFFCLNSDTHEIESILNQVGFDLQVEGTVERKGRTQVYFKEPRTTIVRDKWTYLRLASRRMS